MIWAWEKVWVNIQEWECSEADNIINWQRKEEGIYDLAGEQEAGNISEWLGVWEWDRGGGWEWMRKSECMWK